ncbi:MAG: hypothetical protein AB7G39_04400 [Alphaproteobacteria bacterium]
MALSLALLAGIASLPDAPLQRGGQAGLNRAAGPELQKAAVSDFAGTAQALLPKVKPRLPAGDVEPVAGGVPESSVALPFAGRSGAAGIPVPGAGYRERAHLRPAPTGPPSPILHI